MKARCENFKYFINVVKNLMTVGISYTPKEIKYIRVRTYVFVLHYTEEGNGLVSENVFIIVCGNVHVIWKIKLLQTNPQN